MKIQVLVATMHQRDHSLLDRMNLQSDCIVGNQCDRNEVEEFEYNGHHVKWLSFNERGVGLNRNNALMRADADVCLFADDDMRYVDNYPSVVENAFKELPDADVIVFNLIEENSDRHRITKTQRVRWHNYLRYGTARVAFKFAPVKNNGIYFNQCFGGGTEHCHGEDNLFLTACLRNKLKIYAFPQNIATLTDERASTWNSGYDEKYLTDQGTLYKAISRKYWRLLCLQDALRHSSSYKMSWSRAYKLMIGKRK